MPPSGLACDTIRRRDAGIYAGGEEQGAGAHEKNANDLVRPRKKKHENQAPRVCR